MEDLYEKAIQIPSLLMAFDKVKENSGGPGVDHQTIEDFAASLSRNISALHKDLATGRYEALPLHRVYIDKDDGSKRPLSIPTVRDRVVQTSVAKVLTPILEPEMEDASFAYRHGRSWQDAVRQVVRFRDKGFRWVVDADIDDYFENIPHRALLETIEKYVQDPNMLSFIAAWLDAKVLDRARLYQVAQGVPQGSPLSPLISNLYLDAFDEALTRKKLRLVRFADDFVILCRSLSEARRALVLTEETLSLLALSVNDRKTQITNFDRGFRFLGTHFLKDSAFHPSFLDHDPDEKPEPGRPPPERPVLPDPCTGVGKAFRQAMEKLPARDAHQTWEDLNQESSEADLPSPPEEMEEPMLRTLYLMEQGSELGKESQRFVIRYKGGVERKIHALKVDQIFIFGNVQVTTQAMQFCLLQGIPVFLLSSRGRYYGVLESNATERVQTLLKQVRCQKDPAFRLAFSRAVVRGKVHNARGLIRRYGDSKTQAAVDQCRQELKRILERIPKTKSIEALMGLEGAAAAAYFQTCSKLLRGVWGFRGRKRKPPPDPVNSLLSFGYTLLFHNIYTIVRAEGLSPHVAFYHSTREGHPALCSDLMEEFRAPLIDQTVFGLIRKGQVKVEDFELPQGPGMPCLLRNEARKTVIRAFEAAFSRRIHHPDLAKPCDYRRAMHLQCRRLVQAFDGGAYEPFRIR